MHPAEITNRTFDGAFQGYDKSQVRQFLAEVSAEYEAVMSRVEDAEANLAAMQTRLGSLDELVRTSGERCRAAEVRIAELEQVESRVADLGRLEARLAELEGAEARVAELEGELDALLSAAATPTDAAKHLGEEVTAVLESAVAAGQSIRTEAEAWAEQLRHDADKEVSEQRDAARAEIAELIERGQERLQQLSAGESALRTWLREAQVSIDQLLQDSEPEPQAIELTEPVIQLNELPAAEPPQWADDLPVETL